MAAGSTHREIRPPIHVEIPMERCSLGSPTSQLDHTYASQPARAAAPFFIVGCPRSGTTLLSQILDSHSRIAVCHETLYYPLFRSNLHRYGDLRRSSNVRRLIEDFRKMMRLKGVDSPAPDAFEEALIAPTFEGVLTTFLHLYARARGKARSGEKTPRHHAYLGEILEGFPSSAGIFVMRDPRDAVPSIRTMFHTSVDGAIRWWNDAFESYRRSTDSVRLVRYEDLVRDPPRVVESICASLGEAYEPTMLRFFEHVPDRLRELPHHRKLAMPVDSGSVGRFRGLSTSEVARIESACALGMDVIGYPFTTSRRHAALRVRRRGLARWDAVMGRLRLYRARPDVLRLGWLRWKMTVRVRITYILRLGPFRRVHT